MSVLLGAVMDNWRLSTGMPVILSSTAFIGLMIVHESPDWLMNKGRWEKARKSFEFYGNADDDIENIIKERQKSGTSNEAKTSQTNNENVLKEMMKMRTLKPLCLLIPLVCGLEVSGYCMVTTNMVIVLQKLLTFLNPYNVAAGISIMRFVFALGATLFLQKVPRRKAYISMSIVHFMTILGLGIYSYLLNTGWITKDFIQAYSFIDYFPAVGISIMYFTFAFGYGNVPFALMGELFPQSTKTPCNK